MNRMIFPHAAQLNIKKCYSAPARLDVPPAYKTGSGVAKILGLMGPSVFLTSVRRLTWEFPTWA